MRERGWEAALKNELAFESEKRSQSSAGSIVALIKYALATASKSNTARDLHDSKSEQEVLRISPPLTSPNLAKSHRGLRMIVDDRGASPRLLSHRLLEVVAPVGRL